MAALGKRGWVPTWKSLKTRGELHHCRVSCSHVSGRTLESTVSLPSIGRFVNAGEVMAPWNLVMQETPVSQDWQRLTKYCVLGCSRHKTHHWNESTHGPDVPETALTATASETHQGCIYWIASSDAILGHCMSQILCFRRAQVTNDSTTRRRS